MADSSCEHAPCGIVDQPSDSQAGNRLSRLPVQYAYGDCKIGSAAAKKNYLQAENLYQQQIARRAKSMLNPKGHMADDWTRRYLIPITSPDYAKWKAKSGAHQGVTVTMKRPEGKEAELSNAGGLKHEQYFPWGSDDWRAANGMRNGVESVNRNIKRSQYEDIADPDKRAVRGNTFTYLVVALAAVVENLRKIISFYKDQLAVKTLSPKNNRLPASFWQSEAPSGDSSQESLAPPG